MGTYERAAGLRSGILAVLAEREDRGTVNVHYEPAKDRSALLERYVDREVNKARGVILTPGDAFHSSRVLAVGGDDLTFEDIFRWDLARLWAAKNDDTEREEALASALGIFDALRAKLDFSAYGVELMLAPKVTLQNHGFHMLSGFGVWWTEMVLEYTVGVEVVAT